MRTGPRRRPGWTAVVVALAALSVAGPAVASTASGPTGRISDVTTEPGTVRFLYSSADLPADVGLDAASVAVVFQQPGQEPVPLEASASSLGGSPELARQTAVLAVDTSGSLGDDGMAAVQTAAVAFLDAVPDAVEVGLVTFGDPAVAVLPPSTDRGAVRAAVAGLQSSGGTALFDATVEATLMLPGEGIQRIVLLTDGADDNADGTGPGSDRTLDAAVAAVQGSAAGLTAVAFGDGTSQTELQALALAGGGQVVDATEADDLAGAFQAVAESIATDLVVTAQVPESLDGARGNLVLTAQAGNLTLTTAAFTTLAAPPAAAPSPEPSETAEMFPLPVDVPAVAAASDRSPVLYAALAGIFLALLTVAAVLVGLLRGRDPQQAQRQRSLAIYSLRSRGGGPRKVEQEDAPSTRLGDSAIARSAVEFAGRAVERRNATERLARTLDAASVPLRPGEWVVLHVAIAFGAGILLLLLSAGNILVMLAGLALGGLGPRIYLAVRTTRRKGAFLRVMPDTLGLMASGLRAGYSMPQAMDSVAREGQEPLRSEFNRALVEARLGVPPEDAMEGIADRMDSRDFRWVVMAIRIQREVGGNLAELLDTVAGTLRERARLRRQVDVLSAEGRLSAWIVGLLPVVFSLYLLVAQPGYLRPLYTEPLGFALLGLGGVMFLVGVLTLRWAVKVDV